MYKEKDTDGGKLNIGPAWDYDRGYCCVEGWVWELTHTGWPFPDWWSILHTDSVFLHQRHCRWQELREGAWTTDAFLQMVDSLHLLLGDAAPRNFQRWPELGFADFNGNVAARKANIAARLEWMDGQISGESCEVLPSATKEHGLAQWRLFPNPADDLVLIDMGQMSDALQLTIHDLNGKVLFAKSIQVGEQRIHVDVSKWPSGFYLVESVNEAGRRVAKLTVF
ncbi:MAG: CotH kinase family protein [Saprospiraceae bacterium]|nr:CotH kinase family protein [Saprospiraceae bacterium]